MSRLRSPLVALVARFAARLRFPWLFGITAALFLLSLVIPDPVPFADEMLLALATAVLGSLRRGRDATASDAQAGPRASSR